MIIPLGHDSGEVRRQPWVTYGIILACALVFLATQVLGREGSARAERLLGDAYEYWKAHPYLEAAPRLGALTGEPGRAIREESLAASGEREEPPLPSAFLEAEQRKLDELTEQALAALEEHPWYRFGLIPSAPTATGLFAHMFLHAGWLHLIPNLFFLFLTGCFIEDRWGRGLYALFYVAAAVAGAVLFVSKNPGLEQPLIGASGAVAGAMGAFLVCFARARIRFFYWLGIFFGTFHAPAWLMLPLWFANELFTASLMDAIHPGGGAGVAYWAHVGGFGFGVVAALAIRFSGIEARLSKKLGGEWSYGRDSVLSYATTARAEGRPEEALDLLRFALEQNPEDADLALLLFETAVGLGRADEGAAFLAPVVWAEVERGEREAAVSHWQALCEAGARVWAEPPILLRLAGWLRDARRPDAASLALRCVLDRCPGDPAVAMRVARLARGFDPATALEAAEIALSDPALAPAEREALEAIIAETESGAEERRGPQAEPLAALERGDEEEPKSFEPRVFRTLRVIDAVPLELDAEALWLDVDGKGRTRLALSQVDAVAAAGVHGLGGKAVILVDLALNWTSGGEKPLTVLRLRSDRYDPRKLVGSAGSPLQAMSELLSTLIARARACPLPDPDSARGQPFKIFRDLASYEEQVLGAERPPVEDVFQSRSADPEPD